MIEPNRPLCCVIPADFDDYKHRDLRVQLSETVDVDYESITDDFSLIVEACHAEWPKPELDEAGNQVISEEFGFTLRVTHYVKCMEPAIYYMSVPHAMLSGSFCEYHKPKVRVF